MSRELRLDPELAREAGVRLQQAGQDLSRLRSEAGAALDHAGAARPWGSDTVGAAVQANYDSLVPTFLESWANLGSFVEAMGGEAVRAVELTLGADAAAARRLGEG